MGHIHIQQDLSGGKAQFNNAPELVATHLNCDEMEYIIHMLQLCITQAIANEQQLDSYVLNELQITISEKYEQIRRRGYIGKKKPGCTFRFRRSSSFVLFCWMLEYSFDHPLHNTLAYSIVDQIYRQVV